MSIITGKVKNKDAFEKTAEQFTKASGFSVKRRRGACKRMGLVKNGTLSSQTELPRIPNRNVPKFFVNGKCPPGSSRLALIYISQNDVTSYTPAPMRLRASENKQNGGRLWEISAVVALKVAAIADCVEEVTVSD